MTNNRVHRGHLSGILLVVTAILSAHPCAVFSQDLESRSATTQRSQGDPSSVPASVPDHDKDHAPLADDAVVANLPDAPMPQDQAQDQSPPSPVDSGTHLNPFPILSPRLTRAPLTLQNKFLIYTHKTFGPPAVILPAFGAGLAMLNPPNRYPREWKDGASAFGRNYGETVATGTARKTAGMLAGIAFHEDPRYMPSTSSNVVFRIGHALAYTVVDRTDSGRKTIAFSNFAAAGAGGLVGMAYLPNGFNGATHAEQRILAQFSAVAVRNLAAEFQPQWAPIVRILRIPKLLPEWWVPLRPRP